MKKLVFGLALIWGAGAAAVWYWNDRNAARWEFRTVLAARGDLLATINATGTIEPEEVVDVGAQIAGEIVEFGKDPRDPKKSISYGSPVEQGTVLARLNAALHKTRVNQAKANVIKAEADIQSAEAKARQARRELDRAKQLGIRGTISAQEYDADLANAESAEAAIAVARGALAVAVANLEEASVNLGYTTIKSPVQGVILDRRVNIGQTVVASLNAPSLFLIAKDLKKMEIWASVNETDVGQVRVGQGVKFAVADSPGDSFRGEVATIRLNASMAQNVVTYTVVVNVDNASGRLLPYLTARLQFEVETRKGVVMLPNAALRFRPRLEQVVPEAREAVRESLRRRPQAAKPDEASRSRGEAGWTRATLWARDGELLRPVEVEAGLSDGVRTEVRGAAASEGREFVVGQVPKSEANVTPFLPQFGGEEATP